MQNSYLPFGMVMPGRKFEQNNGINYRYSINGQERSDELNSNLTTALYWEYDSRIGRRWNVDPKGFTWESLYSCFGNNPLSMVDLNGDIYSPIKSSKKNPGEGTSTRDNPSNVIGIWGHSALNNYFQGIKPLNPFMNSNNRWMTYSVLESGKRPDLIDAVLKIVWELKPDSYLNSKSKGKNADTQIDNYVKEINNEGLLTYNQNISYRDKFRKGGLPSEVPFPDGLTLENNGYRYTYSIPNPSTGLIYYKYTKISDKERKSVNETVKATVLSNKKANQFEIIRPIQKMPEPKKEIQKESNRNTQPWKLVPILRILDIFTWFVDFDKELGTKPSPVFEF